MAVSRNFPKLFEPGQIGNVRIRNRTVQGPTERHTPSAYGGISQWTIDYYVERAKGGFGLIQIGATDIGLGGRKAHQLNLAENRFIIEHCNLTEAVHAYGAKIAVQLGAIGRNVPPGSWGHGQPVVSASSVPAMMVGEIPYPVPRPLEKWEIYQIMDLFAAAAERARAGGYDVVQIMSAHGFLLNSFISPLMNKRRDEFGGSLENRMRFLLGIVKRIRETAGNDYPIEVRISGDEFINGGITTDESAVIAKILEEAGVASINVSAGIYESYWKCNDVMRMPEGWKAYIWEAVKRAVSIPVLAQGVLRSPEVCEKIIATAKADFVVLSRGAMSDPYWPKKVAEDRLGDINKCISCNECHPGMGGMARRDRWAARCTVNAAMGREREFGDIKPAIVKKKVMIIGAGPAGMEAARVASLRGHQVTLFEKTDRLGGQLVLASKPPGKYKIDWFRDYLMRQLSKQNIEISLNTDVTSELVESIQPDVVILATGSEPVVPDIPGIRDRRVTTARDVLAESVKITDKNVVVCGGGMVGAETAELLAEQGNSVTVIEQFPYIAYDMELLHRKALVDSLREKGVVLLTERKLMGVAEGHVLVEPSRLAPGAFRPQSIQFESSRGNPPTDEKERFLADWVILALGTKPVRGLAESLEQSVDEVYTVGDCEEPRRILEAVYEGLLVACRI